jgi:cytochrome P450
MVTKEPRYRENFDTLVSDMRVFGLAGFETTAHGLSFAFGMLAKHPEWAETIAKEGRAVWELLKTDPQQALDESPTARYFFLETLRVYPPVPALPGRILEDVEVTTKDGDKYGLEKGCNVLFLNMVLNRDCGDDFDPSRWKSDPQPFLNTFNTGPHVCPGKNLSLLEGHVFLLMAATKYKFFFPGETPESLEYLNTVLLKPKDGMPLIVKERVW